MPWEAWNGLYFSFQCVCYFPWEAEGASVSQGRHRLGPAVGRSASTTPGAVHTAGVSASSSLWGRCFLLSLKVFSSEFMVILECLPVFPDGPFFHILLTPHLIGDVSFTLSQSQPFLVSIT